MKQKRIQDLVYKLARPIAESKGLELVAVEYLKEGANWYLRIYIDKEKGVDHEDCQAVSMEISELLDEKDPIPMAYFLEVSSPGIERIIQTEKDFLKYADAVVNVHTYTPINKRKKFKGRLGPVSETTLVLWADGDTKLELPREKVSQVRIAWEE